MAFHGKDKTFFLIPSHRWLLLCPNFLSLTVNRSGYKIRLETFFGTVKRKKEIACSSKTKQEKSQSSFYAQFSFFLSQCGFFRVPKRRTQVIVTQVTERETSISFSSSWTLFPPLGLLFCRLRSHIKAKKTIMPFTSPSRSPSSLHMSHLCSLLSSVTVHCCRREDLCPRVMCEKDCWASFTGEMKFGSRTVSGA